MNPERLRRDPTAEKVEREETLKELMEKAKELNKFLGILAKRLKSEGVPVTSGCRIKMKPFKSVYDQKEIKEDIEQVNKLLSEWYPNLTEEQIKEIRLMSDGERLEMLKTAIFAKNLGDKFIVVRSSFYDDFKNHVDNIIVDRESGAVVCAVDLVADISDSRYENKIKEICQRNSEGGAKVKYGFTTEKDKEGRISIRLVGEIKNIPVFCLPLPKDKIEEALLKFTPSLKEQSDYEKHLFIYFILVIISQIVMLNQMRLNRELRNRLIHIKPRFKEIIEQNRQLIEEIIKQNPEFKKIIEEFLKT